ncbi:hypothetical protein ACGO3R_13735 [Lactococcus lactis]
MVTSVNEYQSIIIETMKFIVEGKIPAPALEQFQIQQNQVANEIGMPYEINAGLAEILSYCVNNNTYTYNKSVELLFRALNANNKNIKYLYGLN